MTKDNLEKSYKQNSFYVFPFIIFIGIFLVGFISFFGRRVSISQDYLAEMPPQGEVLAAKQVKSIVNQCVVMDGVVKACEVNGKLNPRRELKLVYDELVSSYPPGYGAQGQCKVENGSNAGLTISIDFIIVGSTARVQINASSIGTIQFGHFMPVIQLPGGGKIDGYEYGSWMAGESPGSFVWEKNIQP